MSELETQTLKGRINELHKEVQALDWDWRTRKIDWDYTQKQALNLWDKIWYTYRDLFEAQKDKPVTYLNDEHRELYALQVHLRMYVGPRAGKPKKTKEEIINFKYISQKENKNVKI